jgi:hypothetical protein
LDQAVVEAACHVVLSKPSSMLEALKHTRVPIPVLWCEWEDRGRRAMRDALGISVDNQKPLPKRFGFLITADEDGLAGTVEYAWKHPREESSAAAPLISAGYRIDPDDGCCVSNLMNQFDFRRLDTPLELDLPSDLGMMQRWRQPEQVEALKHLDNLAMTHWTRTGSALMNAFAQVTPDQVEQMIASVRDDINGEFLQMLSTLILLTARNGMESREVTHSPKLNRSRIARGKPALLEHRVVTMRLSPGEAKDSRGRGVGHLSGPRRAHLVCGHYVTRGGTVFWRRSHMRGGKGHGTVGPKTIRVVS